MIIKMTGFHKPHYTSKILEKGNCYRSQDIWGGVDMCKKIINLGLGFEVKDKNVKVQSTGKSLSVERAERLKKEEKESNDRIDDTMATIRRNAKAQREAKFDELRAKDIAKEEEVKEEEVTYQKNEVHTPQSVNVKPVTTRRGRRKASK